MVSFIVFISFLGLLVLLLFGAFGAYIAGQKGISPLKGLLIGILLNFFGLIWLAFKKNTSENLVEQMYNRELIDLKEFQDTMEFKVKKKK